MTDEGGQLGLMALLWGETLSEMGSVHMVRDSVWRPRVSLVVLFS